MDEKETNATYVTWAEFKEDCMSRYNNFKSHPILFFYFFIVVVVVGASGVWLPFLTEDTCNPCFSTNVTISLGLATYCIALLSAAMADNLLSFEKLKTLRFFIFSLFLLCITLAYVTLITKNVFLGAVTTTLTLALWILNYSDDSAKKDKKDQLGSEPAGGRTDQELGGSLQGFNT